MPEGSWKCEQCNNINYPFRTKCNRQNCGADKPSDKKESPSETADAKDQGCFVIYVHCLNLNIQLFAPNYPMYICNRSKLLYTQSFSRTLYLRIYLAPAILILLFLKCIHVHFLLACVLSFHVLIELSTVPVSTRYV